MSNTPRPPELDERLRRLAERRGQSPQAAGSAQERSRTRRHHPAARSRFAVLGLSLGTLLGLVGGMGINHLASQALAGPAVGAVSSNPGDRTVASPSIVSGGATPAPTPRAAAPLTQTQGS